MRVDKLHEIIFLNVYFVTCRVLLFPFDYWGLLESLYLITNKHTAHIT